MSTILIIIAGIILIVLVIKLLKTKSSDTIIESSHSINYEYLDKLLKRGVKKNIIGDYKSAVAIADQILLLDPNYYEALTLRAHGLEALKFYLDAIDDYEKALSIDSSDGNIFGLLGLTYMKIGDFENAAKNLGISAKMGFRTYEEMYKLIISRSDNFKKRFIENAKKPENLLRRNPSDFVDDFEDIDNNMFIEALKRNIHYLEDAILNNPNNVKLKEIYNRVKKDIEASK